MAEIHCDSALCSCPADGGGGGLGLLALGSEDLLGDKTYEEAVAETTELMLSSQAESFARNWASVEYGEMPEDLAQKRSNFQRWSWLDENGYAYTILDEAGEELYSFGDVPEAEREEEYTFQRLEYIYFLCDGYDDELRERERGFFEEYYSLSDGTHLCFTARGRDWRSPLR